MSERAAVSDGDMSKRRWRRVLRVLLPVNLAGTLVAYLIMLGQVESVVASGPLLFLAGMITVLSARAIRYPLGMIVGGAQAGICVLFVSLVNLLHWGPSAAERPFELMGIVYIMGFLPAAVAAMLKIPEIRGFGHCAQCGYMLYGLTEARCPECGRGFDPAMLPALSPPPAEAKKAADS